MDWVLLQTRASANAASAALTLPQFTDVLRPLGQLHGRMPVVTAVDGVCHKRAAVQAAAASAAAALCNESSSSAAFVTGTVSQLFMVCIIHKASSINSSSTASMTLQPEAAATA